MPIGTNRVYNDPALGQAFSNLSSLFAPPSGSDLSGYAAAAAKKEEAARLAELFRVAQDPNADWSTLDRLGIGAGVFNPSQSLEAVDRNNSTQRYGYDRSYQSSRENNTADNARALQTSAMDNQRSAITSLYGALKPGEVAPAVPGDVAGLVGLPGIDQRSGLAPILSEAEVKGRERQRLTENGMLTEQMLLDSILGEKSPVQAVGPGGTPTFMSPGAAVREGAQPFVQAGSQAKPTNAVAVTADGQNIPAVQGPDGKWIHAQTGAPLPADIRIFDLPKATGTAGDVGMAPTTANQTQANNQEAEVTRALSLLDIYEKAVTENPGSLGLAGLIRGTAQNAAQTAADLAASFGDKAPQIETAAREFREELGSVVPEFFDTSIPEIDFLQGTLAYSLARTENPSGEVSRQAFERAYERVKGGGLLANQKSALSAIAANRKVLQTQLQGMSVLRAPGTGRTDTSFRDGANAPTPPAPPSPPTPPAPPSGAERWERGPDGRLRKVQ